jgi:hypothetical protein
MDRPAAGLREHYPTSGTTPEAIVVYRAQALIAGGRDMAEEALIYDCDHPAKLYA